MVSSVALAKEDFSQQVRSYGWQANHSQAGIDFRKQKIPNAFRLGFTTPCPPASQTGTFFGVFWHFRRAPLKVIHRLTFSSQAD
jgi:hypothetical protein